MRIRRSVAVVRFACLVDFNGRVWCRCAINAPERSSKSTLARFLDKATPGEQRQAIFAAWRDSALNGDADAQYVVGTIYRRGDDVLPHVVERDADQARRYLSTAAAHGRLLAMAKMAELELAEDHPLEAMIWAQIYGAYRGWIRTTGQSPDYDAHKELQPTLYFEDLLARTSKRLAQKFGDQKTPEVLAGLNQFVAAHDEDVRAQMWHGGISPRWVEEQVRFENAKSMRRIGVIGKRDMVSEWVLVFADDGSVKSAEAFDALPNFSAANGHHGLVMQYETEAGGQGHAQRFALKTVDLKKSDWPLGPVRTH